MSLFSKTLVLVTALCALGIGYYLGHSSAPAPASSVNTTASPKQLWTCSMHPQVIQDHPGICPICHMELTPVRAGGSDSHVVTIDPAVVQNMGVRTAVVARGPLVQSVRVVGYLEEPEPLHHDINLRVNGWIEKLYANIDGMAIEEGKPLFDLYSPELTVAIDEMISARKQLAISPQDSAGKALLDAAHRKLSQYGLGEKQIDDLATLDSAPRTIPILAPMTGHLTAKMVYEGAAVKAGDLVLRLASRHRMWIDAQVYEQQMSLISDGQPVRATIVSQPGKVFDGKVLFVHPHLDPQTRTATVRIEIPNEDHALRQGMYATVEILADAYHEALTIPREAAIDTGRRQVAFVSLGAGRFEPRDLKLGLPGQDDTVQVLEGLKEGERVVTSGQFLIDSESRSREAIAKFGAASAPTTIPGTTPATAPAVVVEAPQINVPHRDDLVKAYLTLSHSLGARQENPEPLDMTEMINLAQMSAQHAADPAKALIEPLAQAASDMKGKSLEEQRELFVPLSSAVIAIVHQSHPSAEVAKTLYVLHCPMAFHERGADWLQDDDTVANPFYATQMKRCGSVTEEIPLGAPQKGQP